MANNWVATDNAESYANGNAISGLNGGSNWSGAWSVAAGGTKDIVNSPTLEGTLCFHLQKMNTEPEALRGFTAITSGIVSFMIQTDNNTTDAMGFGFVETATVRFYFYIDNNIIGTFGDGHFCMSNGASFTDLGTFSVNTNYTIVIDFDNATDQFRVSLNGGSSFSGYSSYVAAATNIDSLRFRVIAEGATTVNYYFDDIKAGAVLTTTAAVAQPQSISGGATIGGSMNL